MKSKDISPEAWGGILWLLGLGLIVGALVMVNLAILFSSHPHNHQEGWAIFCVLNAIWVAGLGVGCFAYAGSGDLRNAQLDYERKKEREKV